jgi:hypothetical protein
MLEGMSPVTQRARPRRKKSKASTRWLGLLWPLIAGIVVTPFAVWGASVLAMSGPSALRLLYPYLTVIHGSSQQAASQGETISQCVMYGQFPAYGLVWIVMRRLTRGSAGAFSVIVLHCAGVLAAILKAPG